MQVKTPKNYSYIDETCRSCTRFLFNIVEYSFELKIHLNRVDKCDREHIICKEHTITTIVLYKKSAKMHAYTDTYNTNDSKI